MTVDIPDDDDDGGTVKFKGDATVIRPAGSTGGTIEKICWDYKVSFYIKSIQEKQNNA